MFRNLLLHICVCQCIGKGLESNGGERNGTGLGKREQGRDGSNDALTLQLYYLNSFTMKVYLCTTLNILK